MDVVLYDRNPAKFIANALSPAKDVKVIVTDPKKKEAIAVLTRENLSLAIGKKGQNVRLASRLTHYKIDVKCDDEVNYAELKEKYANKIEELEEENKEVIEEVQNEEQPVVESEVISEVENEENTNA